MGRYLDPKADVVFKKIFGQHPHLLKSFKVTSRVDKKLKLLWLRFMREITGDTQEVDPALLAVPEIKEAISLAQESAFSPAELEVYESYWKAVSSEKTLREGSERKGEVQGRIQAMRETAKKMKSDHLPVEVIAKYTGLSTAEIEKL